MGRKSVERVEFENSRKEILKMSSRDSQSGISGKDEEKRYAWEIELEEYRNRKKLNRFLKFGATCGVLSLIISIGLLWFLVIKG